MRGMPPARAESIHAGSVMLEIIINILAKKEIKVSERGVLFGLALMLASDKLPDNFRQIEQI